MMGFRYRLRTLHQFKEALEKVLTMANISENTRQELEQKEKDIIKAIEDIVTGKKGILI